MHPANEAVAGVRVSLRSLATHRTDVAGRGGSTASGLVDNVRPFRG